MLLRASRPPVWKPWWDPFWLRNRLGPEYLIAECCILLQCSGHSAWRFERSRPTKRYIFCKHPRSFIPTTLLGRPALPRHQLKHVSESWTLSVYVQHSWGGESATVPLVKGFSDGPNDWPSLQHLSRKGPVNSFRINLDVYGLCCREICWENTLSIRLSFVEIWICKFCSHSLCHAQGHRSWGFLHAPAIHVRVHGPCARHHGSSGMLHLPFHHCNAAHLWNGWIPPLEFLGSDLYHHQSDPAQLAASRKGTRQNIGCRVFSMLHHDYMVAQQLLPTLWVSPMTTLWGPACTGSWSTTCPPLYWQSKTVHASEYLPPIGVAIAIIEPRPSCQMRCACPRTSPYVSLPAQWICIDIMVSVP